MKRIWNTIFGRSDAAPKRGFDLVLVEPGDTRFESETPANGTVTDGISEQAEAMSDSSEPQLV